MAVIAAWILSLSFVVLAGVHVYWAFGGVWAVSCIVPERNGAPLFAVKGPQTLLVTGAFFLAIAVIWGRLGHPILPGPFWINTAGAWMMTAIFSLRSLGDFRYCGLFKTIRDTSFAYWDSRLYSPLCFLFALLSLAVAIPL